MIFTCVLLTLTTSCSLYDNRKERIMTMPYSLKIDPRLQDSKVKYDLVIKRSIENIQSLAHENEALHTVYRCRGLGKARRSLNALIKWLETKKLKPLQRLRNTLKKWSEEILRYFSTRITNARTEAFNNNSKLVQKRAYGFKSFANYRLKVLNAHG